MSEKKNGVYRSFNGKQHCWISPAWNMCKHHSRRGEKELPANPI